MTKRNSQAGLLALGSLCLVAAMVFAVSMGTKAFAPFASFGSALAGDMFTATAVILAVILAVSIIFFNQNKNEKTMIGYQTLMLSCVSFVLFLQASVGDASALGVSPETLAPLAAAGTLFFSAGNFIN